MISCKKAGELLEKGNIERLSLVERLKLISHTLFCKACRLYKHQSSLIDNLFKRNKENIDFTDDEVVSIKDLIYLFFTGYVA